MRFVAEGDLDSAAGSELDLRYVIPDYIATGFDTCRCVCRGECAVTLKVLGNSNLRGGGEFDALGHL